MYCTSKAHTVFTSHGGLQMFGWSSRLWLAFGSSRVSMGPYQMILATVSKGKQPTATFGVEQI